MQRNLFSYIWRHSRPEQVVILFLVVLAQIFYFMSLTVPKSIVNNGISGNSFKDTPTNKFMVIDLPLPDFLGGTIRLFDGFEVTQLAYLVIMSFLFLAAVVVNGHFKKTINTQKGRMGERMLRRLRYELYDRILRFPPAHFRKVKQAELATMVNNEVEPLGGFIGDAFVAPMFLGGQALTAIIFIMMQNWLLGFVVIALLGVQMWIVPRLRKPVLALGKQRQLTARQFAGRVAETADGVNEIHVHGAANYERADIAERLGRIFKIRFDLFEKKFIAKFWNNFLSQATPFAIYLIGGYFAITGQMDVGAVVGVLLAYKDLPSPIKELIDWDQQRQDVQIKYEQVIDQFQPEGMMSPELQALPGEGPPPPFGSSMALAGITVSEDGRQKTLDSVSLTLPTNAKVAVIGGAGSGKEVLGQVLARLALPSGGSIKVDNDDFYRIPEPHLGARTAYVGQETYLFPLSVRENLLFGLKHRPTRPAIYDEATQRVRDDFFKESERAGNPALDPNADWVDYELAGATGPNDILPRMVATLKVVEFDEDIYQLGLRGTIDSVAHPDLAPRILKARHTLHARLKDPAYAGLVESFDKERYNKNLSVAENLLFGTPVGKTFDFDKLAVDPYVQSVLAETGLDRDLARMGLSIAETMVELFSGLSPDNPLFEQYSFISAAELPNVRLLLQRLGGKGIEAVPPTDLPRLMTLPLRYIEARHRLGLIDATMEDRLLAARRTFAERLPEALKGDIEFYDFERYNGAGTLQDNILFGRLVYGQAQADNRVGGLISEVLKELDLRDAVIEVGLEYNVGVGGKRLATLHRQKLGIARALIKRPQMLVVNEAVAVFDGRTQDRIRDNILASAEDRGVVWIANRPAQAEPFEQVVVMQGGRVNAQGTPTELAARGGLYSELMATG